MPSVGGHRDRIVSLAISPDGTTLASGSNDNTVKLWDLPTRQPQRNPSRTHQFNIRRGF